MRDFRGAWVLVASAFGLVVACGSFNSSDTVTPVADAGLDAANPPVGGDPTGEVTLGVPKDLVLVQNQSLVVDVAITRTSPESGITLSLVGLPSGIAVAPVDVPATTTSAKLSFVVSKIAVQGPLNGVMLEARSGARIVKQVPLTGSVRGGSGELDTTFGTAGIVALANDFDQLAMREDGAFYVLQQLPPYAVRKYTKDGALDTTFATSGVYTPNVNAPVASIAWHAPHLFVAGTTGTDWYARRLDGNGTLDTTYGAAGTYLQAVTGTNAVTRIAVGSLGEAVIVGTIDGYAALAWVTTAGGVALASPNIDSGLSKTVIGVALTGAVHEGTRVVAAGTRQVPRILASTHKFDNTFTASGIYDLDAGAAMRSLALDSAKNYVVGGLESAGEYLLVARLTPDGKPDGTFGTNGVFQPKIATNGGGGALAVSGDKILQVGTIIDGVDYKCIVVRYTNDGKLDSSWGDGGKYTSTFTECYAGEVAPQPDGRIVVSGSKLLRLWP